MSDLGRSTPQGVPGDAQLKTEQVHLRAFARNGAVIEGHAHLPPSGYRGRLSDVLNQGSMQYLAITEATYTLPDAGEAEIHSECVLINTNDITMIDVSPPGGEPPSGDGPD